MDEEIAIEPDLPIYPPIEVDMAVDDTPIILNNDDKNDVEDITPKTITDYKAEMLKDGLVDSDVEYLTRAYKNLEEVKFIKVHCTGCDKHMGSAPNEMANRYQHPILKVLLCAKCFQFYCSGEFEKGEDGSELYCRWCGEGGLVYCCTKCPFVFCKNCITRNLGRGTARIIENTEYWICFSCNPWQISRHRATYWAIQKWSTLMINKSKITGDVTNLEVDANICCQGKKRAEPCEKSRVPIAKKPKIIKLDSSLLENALQNNPSTSKPKTYSNKANLWQSIPLANLGPEDEVICTPDIIPIDESPPSSPFLSTPPPLIPYVMQQQSVSKIQPKPNQLIGKGKIVPINIKTLQKSVQNTFQKHVFSPITRIVANRSSPVNLGMLNQKDGLRIVHLPAPTSPAIKVNDTETGETENDWFDKAIIECAEVTEYVSTKISGLAGVHSRAHKSERLMQELHNTLQTYIHVAIDKMRRIKRNMRENFDKEMNKTEKMVNPFAKTKNIEDSSSQGTQSASEDDVCANKDDDYSTQDTDSTVNSSKTKRKRKNIHVPIQKSTKIQRVPVVDDDDVIFDMDVTNASDEEIESRTTSSVCSEAPFQTEEVINIISSDEDSDIAEVFVSTKETNTTTETKEKDVIEDDSNKEQKEQDTTNKEEVEDTTNKEEVEDTTNKKAVEDTTNKKETEQTDKKDEVNKEQDETITNEIKNPINELVKNVEKKFNIQDISSKDLLNYLSAQVILYNNRNAQKVFAEVATNETKIKENFDIVETIEDILNTEWEQPNTVNEEIEPCDVEEMLGSGVVLRAKKSFGDEFSRFIVKSNENESQNIQSGDEVSENDDNISNNMDVNDDDDANDNKSNVNDDDANEDNKSNVDEEVKDKMSDDSELDEAELFFNKGNESLSLPPDGIGDSISTNNIFATKETENSDLVLDSGILALKQMAENCVNSTVEHRQASTECTG